VKIVKEAINVLNQKKLQLIGLMNNYKKQMDTHKKEIAAIEKHITLFEQRIEKANSEVESCKAAIILLEKPPLNWMETEPDKKTLPEQEEKSEKKVVPK